MNSVFLSNTKMMEATMQALVGLLKCGILASVVSNSKKFCLQAWLQKLESSWSPNTADEALDNLDKTTSVACELIKSLIYTSDILLGKLRPLTKPVMNKISQALGNNLAA